MTTPIPDWSRFTKTIFIYTPIERVYMAWALPANLTQWFLEEAYYLTEAKLRRPDDEFIKKGDRHSWKWHNWELVESGRVLEANGKDQLAFTFGDGGNVHIWLEQKDKGTLLRLVQDQIPEDDHGKMNFYVGCSTAWTFWLTNLKAWLEHGITLNARGLSQGELRHVVNS